MTVVQKARSKVNNFLLLVPRKETIMLCKGALTATNATAVEALSLTARVICVSAKIPWGSHLLL